MKKYLNDLWRLLVPGTTWIVCLWALIVVSGVMIDKPVLPRLLPSLILLVLNLYSWDYQRRHGGVDHGIGDDE